MSFRVSCLSAGSSYARTSLTALSLSALLLASASTAAAQSTAAPSDPQTQSTGSTGGQSANRVVLPEVTVTAQKEPAKAQDLPLSLTTFTPSLMERAGVSFISDAAVVAPNTVFTEFTARKLSNARFRGIGSSPANPSVTTFFDGVPQLNANTSSIELLHVEQIEFVRGPQSSLFGRNTLAGVVNVTSTRPSLTDWSGRVTTPLGNYNARDIRAELSGPLAPTLGIGVAIGHGERDGFTRNQVTGHTVDDRSATFGKAQVFWTPNAQWETRLIVTGERSRDGDYALNDLNSVRSNPYSVSRDFEGRQDRDILGATLVARREGAGLTLTSTTGFVRWTTDDVTDLDYSPLPLVTRDNSEKAHQFSQELRLASAASAPLRVSNSTTLAWQAGVFGFTHRYEQDAVNKFAPYLISEFLPFPIDQHSPQGAIDESGLAAFGQATFTMHNRVDVTLGLRADREHKTADLLTFFDPAIAMPARVDTDKTWSNVSPNASVSFSFGDGQMVYASAARGFKAGGFNPVAPPSADAYDEEHTWTTEGGVKATWADGRIRTNAAVFYIDWTDLQLNLPMLSAPGQFYIANVGGATSRGAELEVTARAAAGIDLFGSLGYTRARFDSGTMSSGVDVSNNDIPFTPDYTAMAGIQYSRSIRSGLDAFGRAEVVRHGAFQYDDANSAGQEAYTLVNLRGGLEIRGIGIEGWIRNAFDTRYVPAAFAYPGFAPSGFVGEPGRPRTFGVNLSVGF